MKKAIAIILGLALLAAVVPCWAEPSVIETMAGLDWSFCSGAGAWSTDLQVQEDGSFTGVFHDSDMGDIGDEYPDGTVSICAFSGRLSLVGQVDEKTWEIRIDELHAEAAEETIEDGVRYVPSEPYGLTEGDVMVLYAPGTPVSILSEDQQFWYQAHIMDFENPPEELELWFLSSVEYDSGFAGYPRESADNP